MENKLQEVVWNGEFNRLTVRLRTKDATEGGVIGAQLFDLDKFDNKEWEELYDNATLLYGTDENPGSLYMISVYVLDKLLGTNFRELQDDLVANDPDALKDKEMRTAYTHLVFTITDGNQMIVLS